MNRRAALQMSIQSIITFILAFIVMGALIGVITVIIDQIERGVEGIPIEQISDPATREEPVKIQNGRLSIEQRERQKEVILSFYNARWSVDSGPIVGSGLDSTTNTITGWENLSFTIDNCNPTPGPGATPPTIEGVYLPDLDEEIKPSDVVGVIGFVTENGFPQGKYSCALNVAANYGTSGTEDLARHQFVLEVE